MIKYEVIQDRRDVGVWRVEVLDADRNGEVTVADFSGPNAEQLARKYKAWVNPHRTSRIEAAEKASFWAIAAAGIAIIGTILLLGCWWSFTGK